MSSWLAKHGEASVRDGMSRCSARKPPAIFLRDNFGGDIARLFLTCTIPAMRADFFRVFWAISEGGIYSDLAFAPTREPLFFDAEKNLTVVKRPDGEVIRNGVFFSRKNCKELKLMGHSHNQWNWVKTGHD